MKDSFSPGFLPGSPVAHQPFQGWSRCLTGPSMEFTEMPCSGSGARPFLVPGVPKCWRIALSCWRCR